MHGPLGEVVEGAFGVNHMADREWRDEKELVCPGAETHVQLQLIQRKKLAFGRLARLRKRTGRDRDKRCLVLGGWKEGGKTDCSAASREALCEAFTFFLCGATKQLWNQEQNLHSV